MSKLLILFTLLTTPLFSKGWELSVGFVVGGSSLDSASSWGRQELNPILGRGRFGGSHLGRKCAITGLSLGAQGLLIKKYPQIKGPLTKMNVVWGSILTGVAIRNFRQ